MRVARWPCVWRPSRGSAPRDHSSMTHIIISAPRLARAGPAGPCMQAQERSVLHNLAAVSSLPWRLAAARAGRGGCHRGLHRSARASPALPHPRPRRAVRGPASRISRSNAEAMPSAEPLRPFQNGNVTRPDGARPRTAHIAPEHVPQSCKATPFTATHPRLPGLPGLPPAAAPRALSPPPPGQSRAQSPPGQGRSTALSVKWRI